MIVPEADAELLQLFQDETTERLGRAGAAACRARPGEGLTEAGSFG